MTITNIRQTGERLYKPVTYPLALADTNRIILSAVRYAAGRGTSMPYWVSQSVRANAKRLTRETLDAIRDTLDAQPRMSVDERSDWSGIRSLNPAIPPVDDGRIDFPSMAVADFTLASAWRYEAEQSDTPDAVKFWTRMLTPLGPVMRSPNWSSCTLRDLKYGRQGDNHDWDAFARLLKEDTTNEA